MSHQLTIEVADDVYQPLVKQALEEGRTPESKAAELVARAVTPVVTGVGIRKWIGAFESNFPDAAERHDDYIGQALDDELRGQRDA